MLATVTVGNLRYYKLYATNISLWHVTTGCPWKEISTHETHWMYYFYFDTLYLYAKCVRTHICQPQIPFADIYFTTCSQSATTGYTWIKDMHGIVITNTKLFIKISIHTVMQVHIHGGAWQIYITWGESVELLKPQKVIASDHLTKFSISNVSIQLNID